MMNMFTAGILEILAAIIFIFLLRFPIACEILSGEVDWEFFLRIFGLKLLISLRAIRTLL
jgi:hypothetical protein